MGERHRLRSSASPVIARPPIPISTWPDGKACCKRTPVADIARNVRKGKPAHQISPVALEAVKRIDAVFDIERDIHGLDAAARLAARQVLSRPLVNNLHDWLHEERAKLSRHNKVAKAINYMFEKDGRWKAFTAFR